MHLISNCERGGGDLPVSLTGSERRVDGNTTTLEDVVFFVYFLLQCWFLRVELTGSLCSVKTSDCEVQSPGLGGKIL